MRTALLAGRSTFIFSISLNSSDFFFATPLFRLSIFKNNRKNIRFCYR